MVSVMTTHLRSTLVAHAGGKLCEHFTAAQARYPASISSCGLRPNPALTPQDFRTMSGVLEHAVNIEGNTNSDDEPISKDAPLFHQEATEDQEAVGSQFVNQATTWFDSIWTNNSAEVTC